MQQYSKYDHDAYGKLRHILISLEPLVVLRILPGMGPH